MDATNVKTFVVGFEKICKNAELVSTLSLSGHVSGAAYLVALRNSISASTGVDVANWTVGGQFEINTRGSESLPVGLLVDSKRHLSQLRRRISSRNLHMWKFTRHLLAVLRIMYKDKSVPPRHLWFRFGATGVVLASHWLAFFTSVQLGGVAVANAAPTQRCRPAPNGIQVHRWITSSSRGFS